MVGTQSMAAAFLAVLPLALAQTSTDCNPLKTTCKSDPGLAQSSFTTDFTSDHSKWTSLPGTSINYGSNGAEFTISKDGNAPTMQTDFYMFFGKVDVVMQASPGQGIVSSIVLESDDLDEIDWEFVGGDTANVQSNFFGKGDTTTYNRGTYIPVASPQTQFHTYTVEHTSEAITWSIDGNVVRTVPYASPLANGGANFPQTPMRVKLGSWAAGGANSPAGTVQWAGGATDFSKAPFTMIVKSVSITNYNPASSYSYGDNSGSFGSIKKDGAVSGSDSSSAAAAASSSSSPATSSAAAVSSAAVAANKPADAATSSAPATTLATSASAAITSSASTPSGTGSAAFPSIMRPSSTSSGPTASASVTLSKGGAASLTVSTVGSLFGLGLAFFMF
ncbi:hypothetical protein MRB53_040649 [Persea americana]|nr:hypothetical protein MRB53_040649 [Persea americana]